MPYPPCLSTYACSEVSTITMGDTPYENGTVFSPYVILKLKTAQDGDFYITVGNQSTSNNLDSDTQQRACITSFQYGFESGGTGIGGEIEILDNTGSLADPLNNAIIKTAADVGKHIGMVEIDFGWIISNCTTGTVTRKSFSDIAQAKLTGLFIQKVDESFDGTNFKYKVELKGPSSVDPMESISKTQGTESQKKTLKQAILDLLVNGEVKRYKSVIFRDENGSTENFAFEDSPANKKGEGPYNVWDTHQKCPLNTVREWLNRVTSRNGKGFQLISTNDGSLVIQEYKKYTNCSFDVPGFSNRTDRPLYIVNGGNYSPVLSFNPSASWLLTTMVGKPPGGISGSTNSAKSNTLLSENMPKELQATQKVGAPVSPVVNQSDWNMRTPSQATEKSAKASDANQAANAGNEQKDFSTFTAELKIMGDPRYSDPLYLNGLALSLVVINPYFVKEQNGCNWITRSVCNPVYSNKGWEIKGVSHDISQGMFTTTFKLSLLTPSLQTAEDNPLGGAGQGTKTFNQTGPGETKALNAEG